MPEYDAFGREVGEDTLAGLRGSDPAPRRVSAPEAPPRPEPAPAAPRPVRPVRRTRGLGCLVGLVIVAAVAVGPVIAVLSLAGDAQDLIDDVTGAVDSLPESAPPPTGIGGRSMIAPDRVGAALGRLRSEGIRNVTYIRLAPDRIDVQGARGGVMSNLQLRHDGSESGTDGGAAPTLTFPVRRVDPALPARLVRRAARRARVGADAVQFVVATPAPPARGPMWLVSFDGGASAQADARGRIVRVSRP